MSFSPQSDLFPYYLEELAYLRRMGSFFAKEHPKVAARLELEPNECADPHVERLLEGFALLTGRLQREIDNSSPQISQALLEVLYPQLVLPIPSMSIAQFKLEESEGKLTSAYRIERHTPLVAEASNGQTCRFRTSAPLELWPVKLDVARFEPCNHFPFLDFRPEVASVLRLSISGSAGPMHDLEMDKLRFFIDGDRSLTPQLIEMVFLNLRGIVLLPDGDPDKPIYLDSDKLSQCGFANDEALLPYPETAHQGYRLLQEYFSYPQKFQFFEVAGLKKRGQATRMDLLLLFDKAPGTLAIGPANFCLGCVPIINLFSHTSDPIIVDETKREYRLLADAVRQRTHEIHSINHVSFSPRRDEQTQIIPAYYSFRHGSDQQSTTYWMARRRESFHGEMPGSELMLQLIDLDGLPSLPSKRIVYAHTLCTNRQLATELPGGAVLHIDCPSPLASARCLLKPSTPIYPSLGGSDIWKLISQLSLNYLSLTEGQESLDALKEILKLYAPPDSRDAAKQIRGLREISCRRVAHHTGTDSWRGYCRGLEVTLVFDDEYFTGTGFFLLGSVLNHFFGLYAAINSFTRLIVCRKGKEGIWYKWAPRAGEQLLL